MKFSGRLLPTDVCFRGNSVMNQGFAQGMQIDRMTRAGRLRAALFVMLAFTVISSVNAVTFAAAAYAQVVSDIRVAGNQRIEPETVISYLTFSAGSRYNEADVNQSLKALFATGLFKDVYIDRQGSTVIVTVVENPVVNKVAFEGNSEIDDKTLAGEVQLKSRSVFTRSRAQADVQRILNIYRRQGQYSAQVTPKLIKLDHNRVNVVFEISEGHATKVKSINFIGNHAFSDSQLQDIITTKQPGWFDFLKSGNVGVYDPDRLILDRELLRQYYLKNGYADARILSAVADLDSDGSGFFITFTVDEGPRYTFGRVEIQSSLSEVNPRSFRDKLLTVEGDVFNASLIDKTVERLTLAVAGTGFAFARVRPRADRDPDARTISLSYVIDEGARIYIERIDISGNTRTRDYVIRREFRLAEGDAYNPLLVNNAKKRLKALGFFGKVDVRRRPGSASDRVVLDVRLVEKSTGELSFGAGLSSSEGVVGDISIAERNLLGRGQFLKLKLSGSLHRVQVDLSFTEPRFLDRNLSAGFDLFHKDVSQSSNNNFRSRKTGGSLRLGAPVASNLWATARYTFSRDEIFNVDNNAALAIKESEGIFYTSSLGLSLVYDTRNHPRAPNRGLYGSVTTDFAGLGGDARYVRIQAEGRAYYPLTDSITLVGRVVGGHIEGWGSNDVRLLDLFYRGGETVRGFDRGGFGPKSKITHDSLGGKTYYAATAEMRFPFPYVPEALGISGAVFADAGSLFGANDTAKNSTEGVIDDHMIRSSVGASLIWNSPVGPLRADYAFILSKSRRDDVQVLRFGAATPF